MTIMSLNAYAVTPGQVLQQIPNVSDPGRVGRKMSGPPASVPDVTAPISEKTQKPTPAELAEQKIQFTLTSIIFQGNTAFTTAELNQAVQPYLNKKISLADLREIVQGITKKYREKGYILSRALLPPQEIKNGVVRVQIIEGFISDVTIAGNPGKVEPMLQAYGQEIKKLKPLNIHQLEYYMLLANDLPGISVKTVLTPSETTSGGADMVMSVERKHGDIAIYYDNYGTRYLGPNEVTASGSLYSLMTAGDNNTLRAATTSRTQEMQFVELVHSQPIGLKGLNLAVGGNYTQTRPQFVLEPLEIVGRSFLLYSDLVYPFIRSRAQNLFLHSMVNYQNVTSTILGGPFYQDRIRSLVLGGTYNLQDRFRGINSVGLDVEHGFPIFGAHDHFYQSRPDGQTVYTKENLSLSRLQAFGARYSLFAAAHGQYSNVPLLATEQFGFGGPDYGRGYDPSEIVGDRGAAGKLELRADTFPEFRLLQGIQYYAFYDAGVVWNIDNVNLQGKISAISTGVGARFIFMPQLTGNFYIAKPLTRQVLTLELLGRNGNCARTFFQLILG